MFVDQDERYNRWRRLLLVLHTNIGRDFLLSLSLSLARVLSQLTPYARMCSTCSAVIGREKKNSTWWKCRWRKAIGLWWWFLLFVKKKRKKRRCPWSKYWKEKKNLNKVTYLISSVRLEMKRAKKDQNIKNEMMTPFSYSRSIDRWKQIWRRRENTHTHKENQCHSCTRTISRRHLNNSFQCLVSLQLFHLQSPRTIYMSRCLDMYNMRLLLRLTCSLTIWPRERENQTY